MWEVCSFGLCHPFGAVGGRSIGAAGEIASLAAPLELYGGCFFEAVERPSLWELWVGCPYLEKWGGCSFESVGGRSFGAVERLPQRSCGGGRSFGAVKRYFLELCIGDFSRAAGRALFWNCRVD
jgi:hypothetical protein